MKNFLLFLLALAIIALGAFLYMIRPVSAPSGNIPPPDTTTTVQPVPTGSQIYVINSSKSEAKFEIDEVLNNSPFHVVGTTHDVSGQITVNLADPKLSSISTITINGRTLKTDSQMRDGMIGRMILKSEANEFITFKTTNVSGLPEKPEIGKEYSFNVTGTLTVAGTSKETTFTVTAKAISETEIQGVAKTTIKYQDFSISIPKVPKVASVEDTVDLTFTFVAEKK